MNITRNWTQRMRVALLLGALVLLTGTGCMYPKELREQNRLPVRESVLLVQDAVERYKNATGVLPIKNFTAETPLFEKYIIDFQKLIGRQYISHAPGAAFENGGTAVFTLIDPEQSPKVRLIDLISFQKTDEVQGWVDQYRRANGAVPAGNEVSPEFYYIDFALLGKKTEQVRSVFGGNLLGFIVHAPSGEVGIDYAPDIYRLVQAAGKAPEQNDDLRLLLAADSFYVPIKSFGYRWHDGKPLPVYGGDR